MEVQKKLLDKTVNMCVTDSNGHILITREEAIDILKVLAGFKRKLEEALRQGK